MLHGEVANQKGSWSVTTPLTLARRAGVRPHTQRCRDFGHDHFASEMPTSLKDIEERTFHSNLLTHTSKTCKRARRNPRACSSFGEILVLPKVEVQGGSDALEGICAGGEPPPAVDPEPRLCPPARAIYGLSPHRSEAANSAEVCGLARTWPTGELPCGG